MSRTPWEDLPGTSKALAAARAKIENGATIDKVRLDMDLSTQ